MDYDSYIELQKQYPRAISNDYLLPDDLRHGLSNGTIMVTADDKALFLFQRREGFTKLHFRIIDASAGLEPTNEILAAFLTYRRESGPAAADWLRSQGFVLTKTLRRYTAYEITGELTSKGIDSASADEAYAMLGEYFSAAELDMPCRELFDSAVCIRSSTGEPVGMLYMGRTLVVAVSPEARGQGLGKRLYRAYAALKSASGEKNVFHEWINPDNHASVTMFKKLGFSADGVFTDCYVR